MHYGSIYGNTAAGRVYRYLMRHEGEWCDPWEMTLACKTTGISTRISEVRAQLDGTGLHLERKREGYNNFYRVVGMDSDK